MKENLGKSLISIRDPRDLERPSKSAITWEYGGTFEGLVRKTCPAVSSTCFQLRDFATPRWRASGDDSSSIENTGQPRQGGERHANLQHGDRSCRQQHLLRAPRLVGTSAPCNCQGRVAGSISFLKKAIHHGGNEKAEGRFRKAFHFNTAVSKSHHLSCAEGRSHAAGSDSEPPAAGALFCRLQSD